MKTILASLSLAALLIQPGWSEEAPKFPKIGDEYRITLPTLKNGSVRLDNIATNVVFVKWIEGSWYEVAGLAGADGVYRTNLNVAHVFTMLEAENKYVTKRLKAAAEKPKPEPAEPE